MADVKVGDVLKEFSKSINTSKVNERRKIFAAVTTCVSRPEFTEAAVKGVIKLLTFTLLRYHDAKSRHVVKELLRALAEKYPEATAKQLYSALKDEAQAQLKNKDSSHHMATVSLVCLTWITIAIRYGLKTKVASAENEFKNLVNLQIAFIYGAWASKKSMREAAYKRMKVIWQEVPDSAIAYADFLTASEPDNYKFCMVACLVRYWTKRKEMDTLTKYKGHFVEQYLKGVLGSRTKPAVHLLESCKEFLRHISHEDFKDKILPAVQKAMLRNPEIVLQAFSYMLGGVTLDLSSYAAEVAKPIATQLHSMQDETRAEAVEACKHLAKQCSDPGAVENVVKYLFAVFNGSEGKLTVAAQRISMLSGIGNMSDNSVSGTNSVQSLSGNVAELFIPVLQQEVHEGTLVHTLSELSKWCMKFSNQVPEKLIEWFKKGPGLKTSTSAVRNMYIRCMNAAFSGDTLIQGLPLLPFLLQTLEKASSQPTQTHLVTEAVSAACLLIRISLADVEVESKLGQFWTIILDSEKQLFLNEKFLSSASDDTLQSLVTLTERLILDHPQRVTDKISQAYYRALIYGLTHGTWQLRKHSKASARKLLSILGGAKIAVGLVQEFRKLLAEQKVEELKKYMENEELPSDSKSIPPRILYECLLTLCSVPGADTMEATLLAVEVLEDAHHPAIMLHRNNLWTEILGKLSLDAAQFVIANIDGLCKKIENDQVLTQGLLSAISTLTRLEPRVAVPRLVGHVLTLWSNPGLVTVTVQEYMIMNTPEGELYDKSVIQSAAQEKVTNIKRESKLYSYAEQMAEIELRKEIEAKNRAKGIIEEPKLTKKQQELKQAQLEKESQIRKSLKELDLQLEHACSIVSASIKGSPAGTRRYIPTLVEGMLPLFSSPLAAPRIAANFTELASAAFQGGKINLGLLIGHATLRLLAPSCELNKWWCIEDLKSQVTRAVDILYQIIVGDQKKGEFGKGHPFLGTTFAYCFHLLKKVLMNSYGDVVQLKALGIICEQAQVRSEDENSEEGPGLLPRTAMFETLIKVIGTHSGKVQHLASRATLDLAMAASGQEGCAMADQSEVNILLQGLQVSTLAVREVALQSLQAMVEVLPTPDVEREPGLELCRRIWVAKFDVDEGNQKMAERLWTEADLQLEEELCSLLPNDVIHSEAVIREAAADALAAALKEFPEQVPLVLEQLMDKYREKLYLAPPVLDSFGRVISEGPPDEWPARSGIALALSKLSPLLTEDQIEPLFSFFVPDGLGDRNGEVRQNMLVSAVAVINGHGKDNVDILLPVFQEFLAKAPDSAGYDAVRQSVVILMGSLAKHLDKDDPQVKPIVAKLIEALSTPSQQVQEAVANCLPPLVPAIKQDAPELVHKLLQLLLESDNYGERKGAAYGLAGLVKGLGILALKQLDIMTTLTDAVQNKKSPRHREGALFAFEMLCTMLGRLFEPYVVHILPHLLLCFGDGNQFVREAADDTAKAVMTKLSAHGVKLVLPSLLAALEEDSWRTKTGSVELLGAMSHCAPKQLSACLPQIVPKLVEVLTDSHHKVQKAGAQALKEIGSVIRNPEIQEIVPILMDALQDPNKKTTTCLQTLLETKFVHFIDSPSLALIMPVVQRSFQDRSTETRKMAAQIIGNMYSLTDQKDLAPYLPNVIPGLKQSLLDPVPEVRSVSAKALGAMVKGMGESSFEDLLPWLMQMMTSEASSVDRSGAAQGLSEVVGGLGIERLHKLMPDVIETAERPDIAPHVRDGYIMLYIYLPGVFGDDFLGYVGPLIPSILKALADESEFLRDTALKAGQRIVAMYADTAIELLLPELEKGLFDDNWRIRYSSVQLLGDLLYKLSGVSGKMSTESAGEDDNFGTEVSQQAINKVLGLERRNRVLAGLYMGRSDTALMVRQAALHVWKVIVSNTPKTLREILSTLFTLLLGCLASTSYDKRQVAARTLGDIVRKLGERVLPEIIPILEHGLESDQSDQRQGVCIGLSEIMSSTSKEHVAVFADSLIPTVRKALCDPLPEVRQAAAKTFDTLHNNIGSRALDDILPDLLKKLDDEMLSEYALDGLTQVMAVKSRVVLPYLVPQLTSSPVNTRALSFLSSVAGEALVKHLHKILPALLSSLSSKLGTEEEQQELEYCQVVVLSVTDDNGVRITLDELIQAFGNSEPGIRCAAVTILEAFCSKTKADYSEYVPQLLRGVIGLFTNTDEKVLNAAWACLNSVTKKLDPTECLQHIGNVRQAVKYAVADNKQEELPGFCLLKKGITPVLPIFREGILNGPMELKEQAAVGLGEVIQRTSAEALKPSVVNITGPLIRILGDRFAWNIKVAVLDTLGLLLGKCGPMLKPFLPQLQTTFVKALQDPNRNVRLRAAAALSKMIVIHVKVDPLFTDLHTGIKNAAETGIRDTMMQALRGCIAGAGKKMNEANKKQILVTLLNSITSPEDSTRMSAAGCLGALCGCLDDEELKGVLDQHLLDAESGLDWLVRHGRSVALSIAVKEAADRVKQDTSVVPIILKNIGADRIPITLSGLRAAGYYLEHQIKSGEPLNEELVAAVLKGMKHESNDVKQLTAQILRHLSKCRGTPFDMSQLKVWVPVVVMGTKEKNTGVRADCEYTLVSLLWMRQGEDVVRAVLAALDAGMKDSLTEVINKSLRKVATQSEPVDDLDDTMLK
ncbi:eIF-2-alpha kinase activator GCN1 [Lingula anatina]|uniref:EIF-2-alpha kinase activator GCN1 n=1 Tax=Lingula anatina TaxID=7574 RepID=A0A1S3JLR5_LINAN|nr:eIF-2-alpha kinase activator GCN1 [Lingula anatina]|eukprot:XP_013411317.1 eIF-2-alpha kinase activator GCN1 [Lingula anatina]